MNETKEREAKVIAEIETTDVQKVRQRFSSYAFLLRDTVKKTEGGK